MATAGQGKTQKSVIVSLLGKLLRRETIIAAVTVGTAVSSVLWYFSHRNHVTATLVMGKADVTQDGSVTELIVPATLTVHNQGDGPIVITGANFAFDDPVGDHETCQKWRTVSRQSNVDSTIPISAGQSVEVKASFVIAETALPSDMCLGIHWRDQTEFQRSYLESVGSFGSYTLIPDPDAGYTVAVNGGLKDVVAIFPAQRCAAVLGERLCL